MEPRRQEPKVARPRPQEKPKRRFCILQLEERIAPRRRGKISGSGGSTYGL
jgi:hypothetical protein